MSDATDVLKRIDALGSDPAPATPPGITLFPELCAQIIAAEEAGFVELHASLLAEYEAACRAYHAGNP